MLVNTNQLQTDEIDTWDKLTSIPLIFEIQRDHLLEKYLANLSPEKPWGDRKDAAQKLGLMGCNEALPGLLEMLQTDPFWMVRCSIIQSLEKIGNPNAISTLTAVAENDSYKVVRSYANKAIDRLSSSSGDLWH